jgi:hypothetical protein
MAGEEDSEIEQVSDPEVPVRTAEEHLNLRKNARARFTRLQQTIKKHVQSKGETAGLLVHRQNLLDLMNECLLHHTNYVHHLEPVGPEDQSKADKWAALVDTTCKKWINFIDRHANVPDTDDQEDDDQIDDPDDEAEVIETRLRAHKRKLAAELEDSQLLEARRVEDIKRKALREQRELEDQLATAKARNQLSSTRTSRGKDPKSFLTGSYTDTDTPPSTVTKDGVDGWIYQPFEEIPAGREGQTMVTMTMLPNVKPFAGDPRQWPIFIQTFKSMVHDMFSSDAHRLTLLHSMLAENLRNGMSQILSSPMAYRDALQELRRKYGHPHVVAQTYVQGLIDLPQVRNETLESFSAQLHGAVSTLESAGFGHELHSSVALAGILGKLPEWLITKWGTRVNKLLPIIPNLRHLDAWLEEQVMIIKNVRPLIAGRRTTTQQAVTTQGTRGRFMSRPPSINAVDEQRQPDQCNVCKAEPWHRLALCPKFISMTPTQRAQEIYDLRNCFRCLGRNHNSSECKKVDQTCGVGSCTGKHHNLLHGAEPVASSRTTRRVQERS